MLTAEKLITIAGLSARTGHHRERIERLITNRSLEPDAYVETREKLQPVFLESRTAEVILLAGPLTRRAKSAAVPQKQS